MNVSKIDHLGCKATDRVTQLSGVIVSISYDLVGCVQGFVQPQVDKDGKTPDGRWFDLSRLEIGKRVMQHGYTNTGAPKIDKGSVEKPAPGR